MAYDPRLAAALSGVTTSQLAYWRTSHGDQAPLLEPEKSKERPVLYSFRDVIALRTVAYLRDTASLQKIRRAVGNLRELGETNHLSTYRLVAVDGLIALVEGEQDAIDLVHQPGQRLIANMVDVLGEFDNFQGRHVPDLLRPRKRLQVDEGVLGGIPVIRGTRIPYDLVSELVADGIPEKRVRDYYPNVSAAAARDAVKYAAYVASAA